MWTLDRGVPPLDPIKVHLDPHGAVRQVQFETAHLVHWDSALINFLLRLEEHCADRRIAFDKNGLPPGVKGLLRLATAVPEREGARRERASVPFLEMVGTETKKIFGSCGEMTEFLGEACLSFVRLFTGRARFRRSDLWLIMQECGARALPIVSLISLLVGLILAFVGAIQLQQFGAQIYVADLVGIAMVREMGAMMTAIVMAGRTGAAFAAQLGTMQVNEEIDAFSTLGFSPIDFLVLPRMLALILMMPLLCIYADAMGILGGALVGVAMLDLTITEYFIETQGAIDMVDIMVGVVKSAVFGVLVALAGCLRGIQCGRSAQAVGLATTSAVVMGIVFIIVTDGIFSVITEAVGI
jgi:phospholipid/cholesterol/gamma-HCH transport system permease protein